MEDDEVFSVMSQCFAPIDESEWHALTKSATWSAFLNGARRSLQDEKTFGCYVGTIERIGRRCPLQDFLSDGEVKALFAPPTFAEKQSFAARHFTGGLPESAVPVESLYGPWMQRDSRETPFAHVGGLYDSDAAHYMRDLIDRMGLSLPTSFASYPDHLAIELDLVAVMLRSGMREEARAFLVERFEWLTAYRMQLMQLHDNASFYIGLIDVILGVRAQQGLVAEQAEV